MALLSPTFGLAAIVLFLGAQVPQLFVLAARYLAELGYEPQEIGVVMGAFNVASLVAMPVGGRLMDRLGRAVPMAAGCAVAAAGCVGFELAGGLPAFAMSRAAQGIGFGLVLVGGFAAVSDAAPPDRLAQALGVAGVLTLVSQALGPTVGEILEDRAGWTWVFRAGAIGSVAGAAVSLLLPRGRPPAAEEGVREGDRALPALAATALAGVGFGAVWSFLADYQDRVTPFFVPYVVAAVAGRLGLGHLADTVGRRPVAIPALAGQGVALAYLAALAGPWHLAGAGAIFGLCHGLYYPTLQALVIERASAGARSRAVARSTFAFGIGIAAGTFALGAVAHAAGYPAIYVVSAALAAVAATVLGGAGRGKSRRGSA